jgi:hypothetical protein
MSMTLIMTETEKVEVEVHRCYGSFYWARQTDSSDDVKAHNSLKTIDSV